MAPSCEAIRQQKKNITLVAKTCVTFGDGTSSGHIIHLYIYFKKPFLTKKHVKSCLFLGDMAKN